MSEEEIASSLGVTGLALTEQAIGPKEKHAVLGAEIARKVLTPRQAELGMSDQDRETIATAILYHDKPEQVVNAENEMPMEVQLLVDLDHLWSFTYLNFWQDTQRKGVAPREYLNNLQRDLDSYFVTELGRQKARSLLLERAREIEQLERENSALLT